MSDDRWTRPRDTAPQPERGSSVTAPELDAVAQQIAYELAIKPDVILSVSPGRSENAKDWFTDCALLLYRAAGESASHTIKRGGETYPVCVRWADREWLVRLAMDWYDLVLARRNARLSGAEFIPAIPHPYTWLFAQIIDYRVGGGKIPAIEPPAARRQSRQETESVA